MRPRLASSRRVAPALANLPTMRWTFLFSSQLTSIRTSCRPGVMSSSSRSEPSCTLNTSAVFFCWP